MYTTIHQYLLSQCRAIERDERENSRVVSAEYDDDYDDQYDEVANTRVDLGVIDGYTEDEEGDDSKEAALKNSGGKKRSNRQLCRSIGR